MAPVPEISDTFHDLPSQEIADPLYCASDLETAAYAWGTPEDAITSDHIALLTSQMEHGRDPLSTYPRDSDDRQHIDSARRSFILTLTRNEKILEAAVRVSPHKRPPVPDRLIGIGLVYGEWGVDPKDAVLKFPSLAFYKEARIRDGIEFSRGHFSDAIIRKMLKDAPYSLLYPDRTLHTVETLEQLGCTQMIQHATEVLDWEPNYILSRFQHFTDMGLDIQKIATVAPRLLLNKPEVMRSKLRLIRGVIRHLHVSDDLSSDFEAAVRDNPDILLRLSRNRLKALAYIVFQSTLDDFAQFSEEVTSKIGRDGKENNPHVAAIRVLSKVKPSELAEEIALSGNGVLITARALVNRKSRQQREMRMVA